MLCLAVGLKAFLWRGGKRLVGTSTPGITMSEQCNLFIYSALDFLCSGKGKFFFPISNN